MDNFSEKITQMMSDPETMSQIQSLASMLGGNNSNNENNVEATQTSPIKKNIKSLKKNVSKNSNSNSNFLANSPIPPEAMSMFIKLAPIFSQMNNENETTNFLHSLRPLLSTRRQGRLDEAVKIMKIMQVLPLIQGQGLFNL